MLRKIFKKEQGIIIGAIHFPPLLGYPGFPGFNVALKNALKDLQVLQAGGVDGVIIENNYDTPHKIMVGPETVSSMVHLGQEMRKKISLPLGVSVLWNDFASSLAIAKVLGARFVRIPVFVDKVKTDYGIVDGDAKAVLEYRRSIKAENIALFTDIQVKHAEILSKRPLVESAQEAIKAGSDALIITGKWTGQAPDLEELKLVRKKVGSFPIFVGSGADIDNVKSLLEYTNGVIVSTSLKKGVGKKEEINIKTWKQRMILNNVRRLMKAIK